MRQALEARLAAAAPILTALEAVERERTARGQDAELARRVVDVKAYQQRRFARSYADLLESPRYGAAARFFLDDLYGPRDFRERDAQFARIVPALVRLFPQDIVGTVLDLARLHALSERLDGAMARALPTSQVDARGYLAAWQVVGEPAARAQQVEYVLAIGRALDRFTRVPMLATSLRMMRGPASAAGLGSLQRFLEAGFDTFKAMRGANEFLVIISEREHSLLSLMFEPCVESDAGHPALVQLP
ncbi:FFLEELY motif protein [Rivibacter subsaxonicus]|uniref:DUF8198 domain-containing protein n=1 Tax=Rivibacter subsaxonicus TaxID=457575 RepID=A0A4Q7VV89_9BURK|nr:hypothetical protein [Rivibacter subsaxonicus]RZU00540.1 hypothetical protein EV670_1240 [Rivibacter subsaxonicus]